MSEQMDKVEETLKEIDEFIRMIELVEHYIERQDGLMLR